MMRMLSPRQLAQALGVSESSLKRWVDAGKIAAARTEGGHRKISLAEAVRFIRETGAPVAQPELLDMPEVAVAQRRAIGSNERLYEYLVDGDVVAARGWLLARYLAGASVAALCDGPVREAMHALGELWHHDEGGIFVEHRGTDICLQALAQLRSTFSSPPSAPIALGATPEDDPYLLPSFMAATVVSSVGMRAVNLGPDTPVSAMRAAVARHVNSAGGANSAAGADPAAGAPRLFWLSVSAPLTADRARELAGWLQALSATTTVVVGGRESHALSVEAPTLRRAETMQELATIARGLLRPDDHAPA